MLQTAWLRGLCKRAAMDESQAAARALVETMLKATGLKPAQLARKAGLQPSTLTRFLNKKVKHTLSTRTLAKLSAASGIAVPLGSAVTPEDSKFAKDAEELAWLDLWRRMSVDTRGILLAALTAAAPSRDEAA